MATKVFHLLRLILAITDPTIYLDSADDFVCFLESFNQLLAFLAARNYGFRLFKQFVIQAFLVQLAEKIALHLLLGVIDHVIHGKLWNHINH